MLDMVQICSPSQRPSAARTRLAPRLPSTLNASTAALLRSSPSVCHSSVENVVYAAMKPTPTIVAKSCAPAPTFFAAKPVTTPSAERAGDVDEEGAGRERLAGPGDPCRPPGLDHRVDPGTGQRAEPAGQEHPDTYPHHARPAG